MKDLLLDDPIEEATVTLAAVSIDEAMESDGHPQWRAILTVDTGTGNTAGVYLSAGELLLIAEKALRIVRKG